MSQCVIKYYCYNMFLFAVEADDSGSGSALLVSWVSAAGGRGHGVKPRMDLVGD